MVWSLKDIMHQKCGTTRYRVCKQPFPVVVGNEVIWDKSGVKFNYFLKQKIFKPINYFLNTSRSHPWNKPDYLWFLKKIK